MDKSAEALSALKRKQAAESERLSAHAEALASRAISNTTIAASTAIIRQVMPDKGRGAIAEPTADLRDIRTDHKLQSAVANDIRIARSSAELLLSGALLLGYRSQVEGTYLPGGTLTLTMTDQDRADLLGYPILGETSAEHAAAIADQLKRDINRALGMPLTGQTDPTKIPAALGAVADQHAKRVSGGVVEAYYAGTQAGVIAAASALVGA